MEKILKNVKPPKWQSVLLAEYVSERALQSLDASDQLWTNLHHSIEVEAHSCFCLLSLTENSCLDTPGGAPGANAQKTKGGEGSNFNNQNSTGNLQRI